MLYGLFILFIIAISILVWKLVFSLLILLLAGVGAIIRIIGTLSIPTIIAIMVFYILFKVLNKNIKE